MLPRNRRLTKHKEFAVVAQNGHLLRSRLLMLRMCGNGMVESRFGLTVSKRVGNAVIRNRIKRRLRDILRHTDIVQGWDIVISSRKEAAASDYVGLAIVLRSLLAQAGVLNAHESRTVAQQ